MDSTKKSYLFAILAILLWSTVSTAFKVALKYMDFLQLLFYSSATSLIIFGLFILFTKKIVVFENYLKNNFVKAAISGFLNPFLYYVVLLQAYSLLPAQMAQPLNYTWPIVLTLFSAKFLGQKLTWKNLVAVFISFAGVFFISSQGKWFSFQNTNLFGVFLAAGSSIIWATYWILNLKDKNETVPKLFGYFLFGTIYSAFACALFSNIVVTETKAVLAAMYVGCFEMGITFILWLTALQNSTSNVKINNLVYLSPFLALIFIHFILGEEIFSTTIFGLCLIIFGIIFQRLRF